LTDVDEHARSLARLALLFATVAISLAVFCVTVLVLRVL